jgi:hypothetical protein
MGNLPGSPSKRGSPSRRGSPTAGGSPLPASGGSPSRRGWAGRRALQQVPVQSPGLVKLQPRTGPRQAMQNEQKEQQSDGDQPSQEEKEAPMLNAAPAGPSNVGEGATGSFSRRSTIPSTGASSSRKPSVSGATLATSLARAFAAGGPEGLDELNPAVLEDGPAKQLTARALLKFLLLDRADAAKAGPIAERDILLALERLDFDSAEQVTRLLFDFLSSFSRDKRADGVNVSLVRAALLGQDPAATPLDGPAYNYDAFERLCASDTEVQSAIAGIFI